VFNPFADGDKVQTDLVHMRRSGLLPYDWLADNTRWQRKPRTFESPAEALEAAAKLHRKALWASADSYVEIWLEKDALSGVVYPITSAYDLPLMVARGYASLSFLHTAAEHINDLEVPTYIYHLGDFDPSGVNAGEKIEETLNELAPDAEIHFERIAVTEDQIAEYDLPTRPTKSSDTRSKNFGNVSVELDAINPDVLRAMVLNAIELHLPEHEYNILKVAEAVGAQTDARPSRHRDRCRTMTERRRLPNRREHELIDFEHVGIRYTAGIGRFPDSAAVAEVFLNVSGKAGGMIDVLARDSAVLASLALQHGATIGTLRHAFICNADGSASGALGVLLDRLAAD
jgi:hypothetical protein